MPSFGPSTSVKLELSSLVEGVDFSLATTTGAFMAVTTLSLLIGFVIAQLLPAQSKIN